MKNQQKTTKRPYQKNGSSYKKPVEAQGVKSEDSTLSKRAREASEIFISKIRDEISKFKEEMEKTIDSDSEYTLEDFKLEVNENTRKSYSGSVLCSVEVTNKKKFKTSKIIIYHGLNGRTNQKFVMITNGVSDDIMFSNIGENVIDVFPSYLSDILLKNLKYVMNTDPKPYQKKEKQVEKSEEMKGSN